VSALDRAAWIAVLLLAGSAVADPLRAASRQGKRLEDLINPLLSPTYALWLAGPVARMASRAEVERYLAATSDAEAEAAIEEFWRRRDTEPAYPGNPLRETFAERAEEADRRFTEAGIPGRRSDRGTIFVLYGEPEEERHEIAEHPDDPPVLLWGYPGGAGKGLDGEKPERIYRFIKRGDVTTFFTPNRRPPRPRLPQPP
jgi:GWxTD domain-containing protein